MIGVEVSRVLCFLVVVICLPDFVSAEQAYDIKLDRTFKVGQSYQIEFGVTRYTKTTFQRPGGEPVHDDLKSAGKINGVLTVLKLTGKKQIAKYQVKNERCVVWRPFSEKMELFPKGAVVVAERVDGKPTYIIDGKKADEQAAQDLAQLLEIMDAEITFDQVYGSQKKRAVNQSWPLNPKMFAQGVKHYGIQVAPENIQGTVTLKKVTAAGDERRQHMLMRATMKDFKVPFEGFNIIKSHCDYQLTGEYPVDRTKPCMNLKARTEFKFETVRKDGNDSMKVHDVVERYEKVLSK